MTGTVLVTGAAGFLGSHVARALVRRGGDVVALVRPAAPAPRLVDLRAALRRVECDLDQPAAVARVLEATRPETVVHVAWYARPADYLASPANARSLVSSAALFEECAARGVAVVGVGSCLEYAPHSRPLREDDPTRPSSLYGACKLAASAVGRALAQARGLRFAWARLFHVHGPDEAPERLLPSIVRALQAGREFELSPGDQVRDHLHVADAAAALVHLALERAEGVFNVCSGRPLSLRELVTTLAEELGRPELLRFGARPAPPAEARFLCGDPARLRALGWAPAHTDLRADLRELAETWDSRSGYAARRTQPVHSDPATPRCPACHAAASQPWLTRHGVPVHQNLLCASAEEARAVPRGEIELRACPGCGLVFNAAFDPARLSYAGAYDSDQSHSAAFLRHVDERIEALLGDGVRGRRVVEVGCGSGYFLRRLCARGSNFGTGYDPAYPGVAPHETAGARFERGLFEPAAHAVRVGPVDVVVARHVIEHVRDPAGFVRALSAGLAGEARIYLETPSLDWIVARVALWDVFYEHCNYFSAAALANALRLGGLRPESVVRVFGGQYLWARAAPTGADTPSLEPAPPLEPLRRFAERGEGARGRLRARAERLAAAGGLVLWGAAAKGATCAHLIDPQATLIRCLVDVNPARQGRFLAGTGHAIVAPHALHELDVGHAIVMNPNYLDEVRAEVARRGLRLRLHALEVA